MELETIIENNVMYEKMLISSPRSPDLRKYSSLPNALKKYNKASFYHRQLRFLDQKWEYLDIDMKENKGVLNKKSNSIKEEIARIESKSIDQRVIEELHRSIKEEVERRQKICHFPTTFSPEQLSQDEEQSNELGKSVSIEDSHYSNESIRPTSPITLTNEINSNKNDIREYKQQLRNKLSKLVKEKNRKKSAPKNRSSSNGEEEYLEKFQISKKKLQKSDICKQFYQFSIENGFRLPICIQRISEDIRVSVDHLSVVTKSETVSNIDDNESIESISISIDPLIPYPPPKPKSSAISPQHRNMVESTY